MRELTGGPMEEEQIPAKNKIISSPPGLKPKTKISSPPGFEPQAKIPTALTRPPPKTTPTTPPPKTEQKKKINKNFVPREDGGPVTRSKTNLSWADVAKLNCDSKQN